MNEKVQIAVCKNFRKEVEQSLINLNISEKQISVFPANCGKPPLDESKLDFDENSPSTILGSVCLANISDQLITEKILRFSNCFHMILNEQLVDYFLSQGAYIVTPGWLKSWKKEVSYWGFNETTAKQFFNESSKYILLLNTGVYENTHNDLEDFSKYVGLPSKELPVGTEYLEKQLKIISLTNKPDKQKDKLKESDYPMMMELLSDLAESLDEDEVINKIIMLFSILFAPTKLYYLPVYDNSPGQLISQPVDDQFASEVPELFKLSESDIPQSMLAYRLYHKEELVAVIKMDGFTFPKYIVHYDNLAQSIINICSLVISNSRTYKLVISQRDKLSRALKDLKETQDKLVESQKMASLGNLVAGVAHEINTPISIGISASSSFVNKVDYIQEKFKTGKLTKSNFEKALTEFKEAAYLIQRNLERTAELIVSFKKVSVDESSDMIRVFKLGPYIDDIITSLGPKLNNKNIKIIVDGDNQLTLNSYPGVFAQIITNLTLNSVNHAFKNTEKPEIRINYTYSKSKLSLVYSDNGCGIPDNIIDKIFDPFFTTNKQIGSGLGLHIVYNLIVQKFEGSIRCENNNGTMFTIELPNINSEK